MTESILVFVEQNAQWAALIVFIVALLESIAIVGVMVPGWVLLVGVGTLIGSDILSFYPIVLAAYLGAVIGEYASYLVGYRYHDSILSLPFFQRHQRMVNSCHEFFEKHGVAGVFYGRFFGPTRAVVPLIAGISQMNKHTFFWVNVLSGIFWAPLYLLPGILVGAALSVDREASYMILGILGLITIMLYLATRYVKQYLYEYNAKVVEKQWKLINGVLCVVIGIVFILSPYWKIFVQILYTLLQKL